MSVFRTSLAFCVRKFLTKILTPLTASLQRQELPCDLAPLTLWKKITRTITRWLNWCCNGAITLGYPHMRYNPIKARRQESLWEWASEILNVSPTTLKETASTFLFEQKNCSNNATSTDKALTKSERFSILICFYHHLDYFKTCLASIQAVIKQTPSTSIEIIIINDDPSIDLTPLLESLDSDFRQKIILYTHSKNQGICSSLNEAISQAQGEWLVHLDCDDLLEPNALSILEKIIHEQPQKRFISSRAADIDSTGDILFWRLRPEQPDELIKNNFASHLKVIKKDLHQDLGLFKKTFEGCQDYEFALRTAIHEPLLFIPNYLYRYRWHHDSQTVSQNQRQNLTAMRIRQTYMLAIYWLTHGTDLLEWNITGAEAASWQNHPMPIPSHSTAYCARYKINFEATLPYDPRRWKLLLVDIATIVIDRHREKNNDKTIGCRLEEV